ncbi:hypothetical protein GGS24DRAFT_501857 [Hypoxylon argillaceum]|nr:hypothetical protein GGS24DRAFT_501857 [Hypoxylon argillaceum]
MRIPPIAVIASWPKPNYTNPQSRAPAGEVIGSMLLVLVTTILAIRLYSRRRLTNGFGLDDTLICLAYVPALAFTVTGIITQRVFQWGHHLWDVEPKLFSANILLILIHMLLFDLATCLTKLSILAMVRRLTTASSNKIEHAAMLILAAIATANSVIFLIVEIFQCWPISSAWEISEAPYSCINEEAHLMSANIINTITDFVVVLLPIRTTMKIQLAPRQRVVVISLFGIGLIASSVGIARTYFTWSLLTAEDYDTTWQCWYVWLSSLIEVHLGIICASIPATKPFFARCVTSMGKLTYKRTMPLLLFESRATRDNEHKGNSRDPGTSSFSPPTLHPADQMSLVNFTLPAINQDPLLGGL